MRTLAIGTPPPNQSLFVTPLGRPLGTNFGDPFGGHGVLGRGPRPGRHRALASGG
jgi:hypothetical protein